MDNNYVELSDNVTHKMRMYEYGPDYLFRREIKSVSEISLAPTENYRWLSIRTDHPEDISSQLAEVLHWHPLMISDEDDIHIRSKYQEYKSFLSVMLVLTKLTRDQDIVDESIQFILYKHLLITIEPIGHRIFDEVLTQLHAHELLNEQPPSMLMYYLMDAIMYSYSEIFEHMDDRLEMLEEEILEGENDDVIQQINDINKYLLTLKKGFWPMNKTILTLARSQHSLISLDAHKYFHDLYEDMAQLNEMVELYRGICDNLYDSHAARANNRMNEIMQTLTVISMIFTPLTFLSSVYGMNFKFIPELEWHFGYPLFWLTNVLITVLLVWYFKRKKWF